ncbi:MAG: RagB/SusD family nutrient uptake outer membrane protein [Muribaculaceae bacterium]|nr:RagB/SusD family nutrient uptake outer membrane protein [Muribaculaceae bacterium]
MKLTNILLGALAAGSLAACADLDTEYLDNIVSSDQKQEVLEQNPDMASASVMGIYSSFFKIFSVYSTAHFDFGYPAVMIGMDSQGLDYISKNSGYNWFSTYNGLEGNQAAGPRSSQLWYYQYSQISTCNTLIGSIPADTDEPELQFYRAQGLATRSFDYWTLAQTYQFNYANFQESPCVPIITDLNSNEVAENGAPRATVREVYEQIMSDINEAIDLLSRSGINPASVITEKPKRMVSLAAAYGLRARYNLTMERWAEAAADAQAAISNFSGAPYSMAEVSKPTFTSINDASWMWGIALAETTDGIAGGSIVNFPAMSCSFAHGYCDQGGAWRWCSKVLYDWIPNTDVRKGWFLDANRKSRNLSEAQQEYIDGFATGTPIYTEDASTNIMPYTNVKFDSYQSVLEQGMNASDIPLMRVEEMYLIKAEAQAMSGDLPGAKETLNNFVRTYRDPAYASVATDAAAFQNEVWMQRRVELWGEGLSFFDIMRLRKDIDRRGCTFPKVWVYNIKYGPGDGDILLNLVPDTEISANRGISSEQNNPAASQPSAVTD